MVEQQAEKEGDSQRDLENDSEKSSQTLRSHNYGHIQPEEAKGGEVGGTIGNQNNGHDSNRPSLGVAEPERAGAEQEENKQSINRPRPQASSQDASKVGASQQEASMRQKSQGGGKNVQQNSEKTPANTFGSPSPQKNGVLNVEQSGAQAMQEENKMGSPVSQRSKRSLGGRMPKFSSKEAPSAGSGESQDNNQSQKQGSQQSLGMGSENGSIAAEERKVVPAAMDVIPEDQPEAHEEEKKEAALANRTDNASDCSFGIQKQIVTDGKGLGAAQNIEEEAQPNSDVDSLLNGQVSDGEYNMSDVEENKNYIEEVKNVDQYETDGSSDSDIPEEHENGMGHNEYLRRYLLNMKTMTWNRDSQGLFDYETRQCQKQKLTTDKASRLVRVNQTCKIKNLDEDILKQDGKKAQVLFNVRKVRNHYLIEPAGTERYARMNEEEKKAFMAKDVDQQYAETGEQLQDPYDTFEKMYLIVRNISNRNVKQPYELKKHDIIKLGRVKFKVKKIHVRQAEDERAMKRQMLKRRESEWRRKEIQRLQEQQKKAEKKRLNSANLNDVINQLQLEQMDADQQEPGAKGQRDREEDKDHEELKNEIRKGKPVTFKSINVKIGNVAQNQRPGGLGELPMIREEEKEEPEERSAFELPEKPKYFDLYDSDEADSEEEMVAGENNYIEINCLPLDGAKPNAEEEKKNNNDSDRSSQYGNNNAAPGEEAKAGAAVAQAPLPDDEDSIFCRFCWDDVNVVENPLLSVCKCSGGVGFVHYVCLKYWLKTKKSENRTQTSWTFYWRTFGCEICHQVFPYIFKANGQKYSLIDIQKPNSDYIVLESLSLEKSTSRIIQILKPYMRVHTFKLGRGLDQDLRVNDISVSRYHAQIKFLHNKFILLDNLSKFGTLVMIKKGLEIFPGQSRSVQIGRSLINLHLSYQKPNEVKTSQILYAPKSQFDKLISAQEQNRVRDKVNKIYESLKENEMYQKRQKMIHMQLHENNFDLNNIYLQRRQLNIQDEEHIDYHSDEEERKVQEAQVAAGGGAQQYPEECKGPSNPVDAGRDVEQQKRQQPEAKLLIEDLEEKRKQFASKFNLMHGGKDAQSRMNPYSAKGQPQGPQRRKIPVRREFLDINGRKQKPPARPEEEKEEAQQKDSKQEDEDKDKDNDEDESQLDGKRPPKK